MSARALRRRCRSGGGGAGVAARRSMWPHRLTEHRSGGETMASARSTKVPKGWEAYYSGLTAITDQFCQTHLNEEYAALARAAIAALCRKRPSPLASGNAQTWACAVLYALGQVNFLHDKASSPTMSMADLCALLGIASST